MDNNILKKILAELEQKHEFALKEAENKKIELFNKYPELKNIEDNINKLYIKKSQFILLNKSNEELNLINKKIENNLKLKKEFLEKLNINANYFLPNYECKICNDTGFINNSFENKNLCKCVKQKLIDECYNKSNIGNLIKDNFNNFNYEIYSNEINKEKYNSNISPRENIKQIRKICEEFIENFDDMNEKNLLFIGNTGLRKNIPFKLYC